MIEDKNIEKISDHLRSNPIMLILIAAGVELEHDLIAKVGDEATVKTRPRYPTEVKKLDMDGMHLQFLVTEQRPEGDRVCKVRY